MASKLHNLLSSLIFLFTVLDFPAKTTPQECPYPCYPPPTGPGGNTPPVATTPPVSTTTPPAVFTTPPSVFVPLTPPPPYSFGAAPPPPDQTVPWFPYFYQKPPHQLDQSFSAPALRGSGNIIVILFPLLFALSYVFYY
ncbi:hypothetical protein ABFS83_12G067300 [Erythranthe nasuta]